jgi:hypothetical protein
LKCREGEKFRVGKSVFFAERTEGEHRDCGENVWRLELYGNGKSAKLKTGAVGSNDRCLWKRMDLREVRQ